ncbi:MAG: cache domain-containing protein [Desulfobacula sp.]|nr:cache domain-containing protein [Desulfobacula sp.]
MTKPRQLTSILWISMISLCVIIVCLMVYLWIGDEIRNAQFQIDNIRQTYIDSQKQMIKTQVKKAVDYVRHEQSLIEKRVRSEVKSRTYEAYGTALYLYNLHKSTKSLKQIKKVVHDALYACSWDGGKGYYFAEDMQGTELINRNNPELEGVNIMNIQDGNGTYIMKVIIAAARSAEQEGYCSYFWNKPEYPGKLVPKVSFVKYFKPFDWVIGNGKYIVDEEEKIKKEVIERIEQIRYGSDGYVFAATWDGDSLSGPFKGKNMRYIVDSNGVKIVDRLIQEARSGGGFVEYTAPGFKGQPPASKISYAESIDEWEWYIGTGVSIDAVENEIIQKRLEVKRTIQALVNKSAGVLCVFILISFVLVRFISVKIKKNLDMFIEFFKRSASQAIPIDQEKVMFSEFQSLAVSANEMAKERQNSEKALRESEKKYRHLFQHAPTGIYEIDFVKGKFINVNDVMCQFSGYSESQFLSMDPKDLFSRETLARFDKRFKMLFKGEELEDTIEADLISKDGELIRIIMASDYILDGDRLKGARVVAHDITDLKRVEKEKIQAEKVAGEQKKLVMVGRIAGKLAHDFNNILGIIMGNTELLLIDSKELETKKKLELILNQTLRGRNLTKNLVAFAKDQEPRQKFFKINEKINLVLTLMKKDLEGIALVRDDDSDVPDLLADPGMIEHALVNLIQNSIHALSMVEYPKIIIKTYSKGDNIFFAIQDNGCGIPEGYLKSIYHPSFTLKGSRDTAGAYKDDIKGTGYGMANVKRYIEQHRGIISVDSEPGVGTRFLISLPVIKKELTHKEKKEIQNGVCHFEKYILLVEDETDISDVQYTVLTQGPCNSKVDIANSGQVALDLFDRNVYDLISLDYILSGKLNGMDVYHHIRKTNEKVPILFISGNIEFLQSIKELKEKDMFVDHLSKPCQNKEYINSINLLLTRSLNI